MSKNTLASISSNELDTITGGKQGAYRTTFGANMGRHQGDRGCASKKAAKAAVDGALGFHLPNPVRVNAERATLVHSPVSDGNRNTP